jgi:hypothetical protein
MDSRLTRFLAWATAPSQHTDQWQRVMKNRSTLIATQFDRMNVHNVLVNPIKQQDIAIFAATAISEEQSPQTIGLGELLVE